MYVKISSVSLIILTLASLRYVLCISVVKAICDHTASAISRDT